MQMKTDEEKILHSFSWQTPSLLIMSEKKKTQNIGSLSKKCHGYEERCQAKHLII